MIGCSSHLPSLSIYLAALPHLHWLVHTARYHVRMRPMEIWKKLIIIISLSINNQAHALNNSVFSLRSLTDWRAKVWVRVQRLGASFVPEIPHPNRTVVTGRNQVLATGVEDDPTHPVVMAHQREQAQPRAHVPNLENKHSSVNDPIP